MAVTIRWKIPSSVSGSSTAHTINIYRSTSTEDGTYNLLASISAGGGNSTSTYTDSSGKASYFYFVRYVPSGGSEGSRVLAVQEPGVKEQRIAEQVEGHLPEIIKARVDSNLIDIRKAMANAIDILNAYSPQTSYTLTNLPGRFETAVVLLTLALLYLEKHLQISIRDYSYGGTGVNLAVDRGSKINASVTQLRQAINDMLKFVKHPDWPTEPMGLGTNALNVPQGRVFGFLFGQ